MSSNDTTYITKDGLTKLEQELQDLKNNKRKEMAKRIEQAKEYGDLAENAEYTEARNEQAFTEGRIAELENILKNSTIIEEDAKKSGVVSVGSKIKISSNGQTKFFHIVGSQEADPAQGKISNESPIGKALLGCKIGETVEISLPKGTMKCEIIEIK